MWHFQALKIAYYDSNTLFIRIGLGSRVKASFLKHALSRCSFVKVVGSESTTHTFPKRCSPLLFAVSKHDTFHIVNMLQPSTKLQRAVLTPSVKEWQCRGFETQTSQNKLQIALPS